MTSYSATNQNGSIGWFHSVHAPSRTRNTMSEREPAPPDAYSPLPHRICMTPCARGWWHWHRTTPPHPPPLGAYSINPATDAKERTPQAVHLAVHLVSSHGRVPGSRHAVAGRCPCPQPRLPPPPPPGRLLPRPLPPAPHRSAATTTSRRRGRPPTTVLACAHPSPDEQGFVDAQLRRRRWRGRSGGRAAARPGGEAVRGGAESGLVGVRGARPHAQGPRPPSRPQRRAPHDRIPQQLRQVDY